ncbi:MAG: class I SAM-dependent methyltransferase [archaeon]|nr:MAG: class I SAM-dependent methyltransferase [archaeon]
MKPNRSPGASKNEDGRRDHTHRFTGRAEDYSKYRPRYPSGVLEVLESNARLGSSSVVADVASGTGILSELFLRNGNVTYCVEPNKEMRALAEEKLAPAYRGRFRSVRGTAERTTLAPSSIDLVTVGQALHWLNLERARTEFRRVLKPGGFVCVLYNELDKKSPAGKEYRRITKAHARNMAKVPEIKRAYLAGLIAGMKVFGIPNEQVLDYKGLVGRAFSASYSPSSDDKEGARALKADLKEMMRKHSVRGKVTLAYTTRIYLGRVARTPGRAPRLRLVSPPP